MAPRKCCGATQAGATHSLRGHRVGNPVMWVRAAPATPSTPPPYPEIGGGNDGVAMKPVSREGVGRMLEIASKPLRGGKDARGCIAVSWLFARFYRGIYL